jgi:hypothetical protein
MEKSIQSHLRDSETILTCELVSAWVINRVQDCYLVLVSHKNTFELA